MSNFCNGCNMNCSIEGNEDLSPNSCGVNIPCKHDNNITCISFTGPGEHCKVCTYKRNKGNQQ